MTKRAFDKINAGLDEARAYLDGTADKRRYGAHLPASSARKIRTHQGKRVIRAKTPSPSR